VSVRIARKPGPQTDDLPRGAYAKSLRPSRAKGWAIIRCPQCGRCSSIKENHEVDAAGVVSPSYVCPFAPCEWHVNIVLDAWADP
jgi:hypothetical protein